MKILSVECSAGPASAAIIENEKLIASAFINVKLTHSQTLMPMVKNLLDSSLISLDDIDAFAVSVGPGSFTGIRIGISAIKGLAAKNKIPCIPVSTLEGMAQLHKSENCIVCAVMDARCNQVYNALFKIENTIITRLCPDRALLCDELAEELKKYSSEKIIITGDGADLFYSYVKELENIKLAIEHQKFQSAVGIAFASLEKNKSEYVSSNELLPVYLRLPQAERELKKKQENKETKL